MYKTFWFLFTVYFPIPVIDVNQLRAVPFKSVGGGGTEGFFEGGEGPNSELIFPNRLHIISGRRGGVPNF